MSHAIAALTLSCVFAAARGSGGSSSDCSRGDCALGKDLPAGGAAAELEAMHEARREYYHGLILHKLNLTAAAPRNWSASIARRTRALETELLSMPDWLLGSGRFLPQDPAAGSETANDFYAQTKQYVTLALDASAECKQASATERVCMKFDFQSISGEDEIVAAKLYVWTRDASIASTGHRGGTMQVRQLSEKLRPAAVVTESPVPSLGDGGGAPGASGNGSSWLYFDLRKDAVRAWIGGGRGVSAGGVRLEMTCKDCARSSAKQQLAADFSEHRAFVLIEVERRPEGGDRKQQKQQQQKQQQRTKRESDSGRSSIYCDEVPAGRQACCIERLQVRFEEFYPFILHPTAFSPNYCRGSCSGFGQQIAYTSTNIVRAKLASQTTPYVPCCVPTRLGSIDVLYLADDGYSVQMKSLPNMVVLECGCM